MAAPAICSLRCLLFARFCSLFSSLLPFVFFSHPSRARPSRGLARPITSGCHRFIYSYLSLPFSFSFPYLFFLFFSFFFPPRVSEPFPPSRFLRGSRSTTLLPLRRFSLSRKMGEDVREIVQSREREREKEYPDREFSNYGANKFIGFISIFFRFCAAFVQTPAVLFFFALDYSMEVCFRKRNVDNRFPDSDVVTTLRTRISFRPLFIYRVYGSPPPLGYELLGRKKFKEIRMGFNFRESVSPKRRGYLSAENFSFL